MDERLSTKDAAVEFLVIRESRLLCRDADLATATAYLYGWPAQAVELFEARRISPWWPARG